MSATSSYSSSTSASVSGYSATSLFSFSTSFSGPSFRRTRAPSTPPVHPPRPRPPLRLVLRSASVALLSRRRTQREYCGVPVVPCLRLLLRRPESELVAGLPLLLVCIPDALAAPVGVGGGRPPGAPVPPTPAPRPGRGSGPTVVTVVGPRCTSIVAR